MPYQQQRQAERVGGGYGSDKKGGEPQNKRPRGSEVLGVECGGVRKQH